MMKTSIYLFLNKKKMFLLQLLILLISCTSLLFFRSLTYSALQTIDANRYEQNGDYFAVIQEGTTVKSEDIKQSDFQLFGEVQLVDTDERFAIGSMSEDYAEKQYIHLLKGRLPQTSTELVVEEHVLKNNALGIGYGESIQLEQKEEGIVREFTIVGVIENYSFSRDNHRELMITEFPSMYTIKDTYAYSVNYQLLSKEDILRFSAFEMGQFGIQGEFSTNVRLFNGLTHYESFHTIQVVVILIVAFFSVFSLVMVYLYQKKTILREIFLLKSLGLPEDKIILNEIVGFGLVGILGIAMGSLLFVIVTPLFALTLMDQLMTQSSIVIKTLLVFIGIIVFMVIGVFLDLKRSTKIEHIEQKPFLNTYSEMMEDKSPFFVKHIYLTLDRYPKLSLLIILILTLVLSGVSFYRILEQEQIDYATVNSSRNVDVITEIDRFDERNGQITFEEDDEWLSWSDIIPIKKLEGIEAIQVRPADEDLYLHLSPEQVTPAISRALYEQNLGKDETSNGNILSLSQNVQWMEVEEYQELIYHLVPEKKEIKDMEALYVASSIDKEQGIQGEDLTLTRTIERDGDYEEEAWSVPIEAIIDRETLGEKDSQMVMQDGIFILPLTATVQKAFADRISGVSVRINPLISDSNYNKFLNYVVEVMSGTSNTYFYDSLGSQQEVHLFRQSFQIFGRTATVIVLSLTIAIVFAIQYSKFLEEKEKYGIYLIHGLTRKKMKGFMLIEISLLFFLAVIFSVLFILFIFFVNPSSESLGEYFSHLFISIIYLFGIISSVYLLIMRKLNKLSIKQLLSE